MMPDAGCEDRRVREESCSVFHKFCPIVITFDKERAHNGWKTVHGFTRNSLFIVAFFCVLAALVPKYVPGTGIDNDRVNERIDGQDQRISQTSSDVAVLKAQFTAITTRLDNVQKWEEDMSEKANVALLGILAFLGGASFKKVFAGTVKFDRSANGRQKEE